MSGKYFCSSGITRVFPPGHLITGLAVMVVVSVFVIVSLSLVVLYLYIIILGQGYYFSLVVLVWGDFLCFTVLLVLS